MQKFGKKTLTVIEQTPHRLGEVAGIGKKTIEKITASYAAQSELRDIMLWLETHRISGTYAARIFKKYGSFSIDTLENHPYQLASEVEGIGFVIADSIAMSLASPLTTAAASPRASTSPCRRLRSRATAASQRRRSRNRHLTS